MSYVHANTVEGLVFLLRCGKYECDNMGREADVKKPT